jgi:RNA polymerase sigma factor (sigma-70 family)
MRDRIPPSSPANRGRILLETQFDLIQRKLRSISRYSGLSIHEAEEFRSWALFKLVDDDYRVLGRWEGRSSFPAFLTVVLTNLLRDYRTHLWGRWRPCAASCRRGPQVVLLEKLLGRDGLSVAEAVERLRLEQGVSLAPEEVERLAAEFPKRQERRQVSDSELLQIAIDGEVESRVEESERAEIADRLCALLTPLLRSLSSEDRLILKLHFFDGLSMAKISPILGRPQRELFSRQDRCLKKLRRSLREGGLGLKQAREIFSHLSFDLKALLPE